MTSKDAMIRKIFGTLLTKAIQNHRKLNKGKGDVDTYLNKLAQDNYYTLPISTIESWRKGKRFPENPENIEALNVLLNFDAENEKKYAEVIYERNMLMKILNFEDSTDRTIDNRVEEMFTTLSLDTKYSYPARSVCKDVLRCIIGVVKYSDFYHFDGLWDDDDILDYDTELEWIYYLVDKYRSGEDMTRLFCELERIVPKDERLIKSELEEYEIYFEDDDEEMILNYVGLWVCISKANVNNYWSEISILMTEILKDWPLIG